MKRVGKQLAEQTKMLRRMDNKMGNSPLGNQIGNQPLGSIDYVDLEDEYESGRSTDQITAKVFRQKMQMADAYGLTDPYMIMTDRERKKISLFKEAELIKEAYEDKIINYVAAILDPEYNYNTGMMVKQPSLLNPPSVSIPIKTLTTVKSDKSTSICISWNPTLFCTKDDVGKIILGTKQNNDPVVANRICSVCYSLPEIDTGSVVHAADDWDAKVRCIPDNLPEIGVSKARLVSAKIKISFRGAVLNQGGTIMGAATFQGVPGLVVHTNNTDQVYLNTPVVESDGSSREVATWRDLFKLSLGDQYDANGQCPFGEKILSNGIWAKNVNITKDASGITAVFIPTDPMDEIFYKPGTFYGEAVASGKITNTSGCATTALVTNKGARLNYLFNIQGLTVATSNPIIIETYQTWEVLPTSQSASALRNSSSNMSSLDTYQKVKDLLGAYFSESTGIHTNKPQQLAGLFDLLKGAAKGVWSALTS